MLVGITLDRIAGPKQKIKDRPRRGA